MHAVLERVIRQIESEAGGLDAETAQLHPKNLAYLWSAQQVIEHLVLGYRATSVALEGRLNKGRLSRQRNKRTWLQWSLQLMILTFGSMPKGLPAPDETTPVPDSFGALDGRQLADLLRKEIGVMDSLLDQCRRKFGMERVATHPLLGPLRVDQWRRYHVVHSDHHLEQLRSILEQVAPASAPLQITKKNLVKEMHVPIQRPLA
jgi:DinB superfamily